MPAASKGKWFKPQKMMRKVLFALTPAALGGIYFFGWRVAALLAVVLLAGMSSEYLLARRRGDPLTESCLVSCMLLALSLPPTLPFWMAIVGIVVAMTFGKEFFGGFGRNVFNPAIVGRAFLYVCFPAEMTANFTPAYKGGIGGFSHWAPQRVLGNLDAVCAATPMWSRRDFGSEANVLQLFLGNIGGTSTGSDGITRVMAAGSIGEVSALLLLLGGVYLLWTKTANWRLALGSLGGAILATGLFRYALGANTVPPLLFTLFSGAMLYACFFMVTDPVSAPKDKRAQLLYAVFIGVMIVFLRWKAVFAGGVAFAILLGNTVGPTFDFMLTKKKGKGS